MKKILFTLLLLLFLGCDFNGQTILNTHKLHKRFTRKYRVKLKIGKVLKDENDVYYFIFAFKEKVTNTLTGGYFQWDLSRLEKTKNIIESGCYEIYAVVEKNFLTKKIIVYPIVKKTFKRKIFLDIQIVQKQKKRKII